MQTTATRRLRPDRMTGEGPRRLVRWLSIAATFGMFVVLVMGATVTSTGSAEGCGKSWPLCQGAFIPEFAVATLIEWSHRAVTGVEGILIVGLAIGAWAFWRQYREIKILVPVMLAFLFAQAGLGAWAVMSPQTPLVLATHFGISLVALASVALTMIFIHGAEGAETLRDRPVPSGFRRLVWGSIAYIYVVVYLGAYMRHTKTSLACFDWPLCNGYVVPGFIGPAGIAFAHRIAALVAAFLVLGLFLWAGRLRTSRPDLYWGSLVALGLILLQSVSGAIIVFTRLSLFSSLGHAAVMSLLFVSLSYLCLHVLPRPRADSAQHSWRTPSEQTPRAYGHVSTPSGRRSG